MISQVKTNLRAEVTNKLLDKVVETPFAQRFKGTILIVVAGVVGMLGGILPYLADAPVWVIPVVSGVATIGAALINRLTEDGFTPSMVKRVAQDVPDVDVQQIEKPDTPPQFSVYH